MITGATLGGAADASTPSLMALEEATPLRTRDKLVGLAVVVDFLNFRRFEGMMKH